MAWPLEYRRAGQVVTVHMPDHVEVWAVIDYLAANLQRPNAEVDARLNAVLAKRDAELMREKYGAQKLRR